MASLTTVPEEYEEGHLQMKGERKNQVSKGIYCHSLRYNKRVQRNWDLWFTRNMDSALNPLWISIWDFFQILEGGLRRNLNLNYLSAESFALSWKLQLIVLLAFLRAFWVVIAVTREHLDDNMAALLASSGTSHIYMGKVGERPCNPFLSQRLNPILFVKRLIGKCS